jgi:hypothetical protein
MQPAGHVISWDEHRMAFRAHYIPEELLERKLNEFLALTQGSNTILQYAQTFNHLCQYAGYHTDNDAKKQDRFCRGLNTKLKERLNLVRANNFSELVNMALTQEDVSWHIMLRRRERLLLDPRVFNHRGIALFLTHRSERHRGIPRLADWFSGCPNNKEGIDLLYLRNNHSNLAQGQMYNKLHREAAIITVSIAGVQIISSGIARGPRNLTKDKVPIRVTRTRVKGR